MDAVEGSRIGSKNHRPIKAEQPCYDATAYEAVITSLFEPWIITGIPDGTWQTIQGRLGAIVRDMLSAKRRGING